MKFITVLRSRFTKEPTESWCEERRKICKVCPHNSKNQGKLSLKRKVVKFFSDLLTLITFAEVKDLGICDCECPVYFFTKDPNHECHAKNNGDGDRWKSIYIPNKKQ